MTIVCRGKTIQGTWKEFVQRLGDLLEKFNFPRSFIDFEINLANGYVVSKTESRSVLGYMNQMIPQLEFDCSKFGTYDSISLNVLEERMINFLSQFGVRLSTYRSPLNYWKTLKILI